MTDDELAVRLLAPLHEDPSGPSTVDVRRAMTEGRKRRFLRRWSGGVALAALTAVAAGGGTVAVAAMHRDPGPRPSPTATADITTKPTVAAPRPPSCTVARLPTGGVTKALVTAGDPSGRYLAGRIYPPGAPVRTAIWKDGVLHSDAELPGEDPQINDLNSSGIGVGSGYTSQDREYAYAVSKGHATRLRGGQGEARAINASGMIVGSVGGALARVPATWASPDAAPTKLAMPKGMRIGESLDVADDGTILGALAPDGTYSLTGYYWSPDGTAHAMPLPTVDGEKSTGFSPTSLNGAWIYGSAVYETKSATSFTAMRYNIATGKYQRLATELQDPVGADNGWILGIGQRGPTLLVGSKAIVLPKYGEQDDYFMSSFSADGGVIAGYSSTGMSNHPLVWRCH
jgi:hypothetical protein